jgi:hypothetical protein
MFSLILNIWKWVKTQVCKFLANQLINFPILAFELRALCLLLESSTTCAHPQPFFIYSFVFKVWSCAFALGCPQIVIPWSTTSSIARITVTGYSSPAYWFRELTNVLPGLGSWDRPDLYNLSIWAYRCEPSHLADLTDFNTQIYLMYILSKMNVCSYKLHKYIYIFVKYAQCNLILSVLWHVANMSIEKS